MRQKVCFTLLALCGAFAAIPCGAAGAANKQRWIVRRMAYDKIITAFRTSGIKFARRQVTVNVPAGDAEVAAAGAATAAIETAGRDSGKVGKS